MAIQGHSFGSFQTNYIIAHTNIFAAAVSSSGVSDNISWYGAVMNPQGNALQYFAEVAKTRFGKSLWERPDIYIKNSPSFRCR